MPKKEITKMNICVSIDIELNRKLKKFAEAEGRSISYIVERLIAQAIEKHEHRGSLSLAELTEQNQLLWGELDHLRTVLSTLRAGCLGEEMKRRTEEAMGNVENEKTTFERALDPSIQGTANRTPRPFATYDIELEPTIRRSVANGDDNREMESQN